MPSSAVDFRFGEAVELLRYGKFRLLAFQTQILASEALIIEPPYPYFAVQPAAEFIFAAKYDYINLAYFYDWGETSRWNTPSVYYEIHHFGNPFKSVDLIQTPEYQEGYYRGNHIRKSDIENSCVVFYDKSINYKLWNSTGVNPENIFVENTTFYFNFHKTYFTQVYDILKKNWNLLSELIDLLKENNELTIEYMDWEYKHVGYQLGMVPKDDLLAAVKAKLKK